MDSTSVHVRHQCNETGRLVRLEPSTFWSEDQRIINSTTKTYRHLKTRVATITTVITWALDTGSLPNKTIPVNTAKYLGAYAPPKW